MVEPSSMGVTTELIEDRTIVMLKVAIGVAEKAAERLALAGPLEAAGEDPRSFWCGPDWWLLVSRKRSGPALIEDCERELDGLLHNAVDYTASLTGIRLSGPGAAELLASGCGIDFRIERFPPGSCCRTQLALIGATIAAAGEDRFEVFVESSFRRYILDWIDDTSNIAALAAAAQQH